MSYFGELQELTTADGLTELFAVGGTQNIPVYGGYGSPPTEFQTEAALNRVGEIETGYSLLARPLMLELWIASACDLETYWDNRARLHDLLRPNRGGLMTLTVQLPDMSRRSIDVRPNPGLQFPPNAGGNAWLIDETVQFLAHNPIWYDSEETSVTSSPELIDDLIFPIEFPIEFSYGYFTASTGPFVYAGTWETYPVITLTGPYTTATIVNTVTAAQIGMIGAIAAGQQRLIDLTPGALNVTDENGNPQFGDVDPLSDFVQFRIKPDPETPGGLNEITALLDGGVIGTSAVTIAYRNRYFGI